MNIINQRFIDLLGLSSSAQMTTSNYEKNSSEMIIIIIISLTTNFIAGFHGLYLPAVKSHSFPFLFSFWVEHMKNGLTTMSNERR